EARQTVILDEAPLPVPPLRPWIRIKEVDAGKTCVRQPVKQFAGVAKMQTDICQRRVVDDDQRLGNGVEERIGANETGARIGSCLFDHMFGATEADLESEILDRRCEERAQIGGACPR